MTAFITDYSRTLAADEEVLIHCAGATAVRCLEGEDSFDIRPDDKNPVAMELGIGFTYKKPFNSLRIKNGATAQTIKLAIGDGTIHDNRMVGQLNITGGIKAAANPTVSYGAVSGGVGSTATLIQSANANRSSCLVQNLGAASIYIGSDNSVTVSNGIEIPAGGNMEIKHTADIYGVCASGSQAARYMEESTS
ncbi:MAG: hypothetical protein KME67_03920 [Candidatus Thiodiazotropha sp. (ex Codakia orbicularis)]|nr:hypothetical protein [Candidatus Thiodiazotropha sp. (ex Codakia orbicularis)]